MNSRPETSGTEATGNVAAGAAGAPGDAAGPGAAEAAAALVTIAAIREAAERIAGAAVRTPVIRSERLGRRIGHEVHLKLENLQATGSFKIRGAFNRCSLLSDDERRRGVICASAGNHGQGVAASARRLGIPATVVVPEGAPYTKVKEIRGYGAQAVLYGESFNEAQERALEICREENRTFVHAYDDPHIVCGQGTIGLEILDAIPEVGTVVVPIGGGGLISGIATAVKALRPEVRVVGVVAAAAPGARHSYERGAIVDVKPGYTIADGIRVKQPGGITFGIIRRLVDEVVEVSEDEIGDAIFDLLGGHKVLAEGAGAAGVAALVSGRVGLGRAPGPVVCVIGGGNIDLDLLSHVVERGLTLAGTYLTLVTHIPDRPGNLTRLLNHLASRGLNILEVEHQRAGIKHPLGVVQIEITAEARDPESTQAVLAELASAGYHVRLAGSC